MSKTRDAWDKLEYSHRVSMDTPQGPRAFDACGDGGTAAWMKAGSVTIKWSQMAVARLIAKSTTTNVKYVGGCDA